MPMLMPEPEACQECFGADGGCDSCAWTGKREAYERLLAQEMQLQADELAESQAIAALDEAIELAHKIGPAAQPIVRKCEEALRALGIETAVILAPTLVDRFQGWARQRMGAGRAD